MNIKTNANLSKESLSGLGHLIRRDDVLKCFQEQMKELNRFYEEIGMFPPCREMLDTKKMELEKCIYIVEHFPSAQ